MENDGPVSARDTDINDPLQKARLHQVERDLSQHRKRRENGPVAVRSEKPKESQERLHTLL